MHQDVLTVIASGALGSIISTLLAGFLSYKQFKADQKEQARKNKESEYDKLRARYNEDEDEIDKLRDRVRDLQDELDKVKNDKRG